MVSAVTNVTALLGNAVWRAHLLRLDTLHPVINGNKPFKLARHLELARTQCQTTLLTFGGAFSNHVAATAAAAERESLRCVVVVRGERSLHLSPTLLDAEARGARLVFVDRETYRQKVIPRAAWEAAGVEAGDPHGHVRIVPEGGGGADGALGASGIAGVTPGWASYSHIMAAVGTGTTLAGLALASLPHQRLIGVSVLKGFHAAEASITACMGEAVITKAKETGDSVEAAERAAAAVAQRVTIEHGYHCGGYARSPPSLLAFMNDWYRRTGVPSDAVYTGKLFAAAQEMARRGAFPADASLLLIHSGGLQGNRGLPPGSLIY